MADGEYADGEYASECPDVSQFAQRPCWQRRASCRGVGTDLWFAGGSGPLKAARALCEACPVRAECFAYALAHVELCGVWAGTGERERMRLRRARRVSRNVGTARYMDGVPTTPVFDFTEGKVEGPSLPLLTAPSELVPATAATDNSTNDD
jgi:WhiB family redox-sensing transcriptional regulator